MDTKNESKEIIFLNNQINSDLHNYELKIINFFDQFKNQFGSLLVNMCKELQLIIHNGRTIGDLHGQCPCYRPYGCSMVDYAITCSKLKSSVLSFNVLEQNNLSDHAAISIHIENNFIKHKQRHKDEHCTSVSNIYNAVAKLSLKINRFSKKKNRNKRKK